MKSTWLLVSASYLALVSGVGAPAFAQEESVEKSDSKQVLDTVVVTSTKREQNLQDIGQTVQAFSGEELRELGLDNVEDVIGLVPGTGFSDTAGGGIPVVIIRGVGLQNFRINDTPTTAIYVDEIYQTSVAEAAATIFDIERVEVLKGPQGGLYGRNAVGGALQIISAKPSFDVFEGYATLDYQEYNRISAEGVVSGPISENLAFRIGAKSITSDDTYFTSTTGNFDHGKEDRFAARGLLQYQPSENVDILFKLHGGADTSDLPLPHAVGFYQPLGLGLGGVTGVANTADGAILNASPTTSTINAICSSVLSGERNPSTCETLNGMTPEELGVSSVFDSAVGSKPVLDNSWWGASIKADVELGDYTLTSISAYDSFDHGRYIDQDTMPEVHQEIDYHSEIEAWSQEFRLGYDAGGDFSWIVGASYSEDELSEDSLLLTDTGILRAQLGGLTRAGQIYVQSSEAIAVFGRSDWQFAPRFNFVSELRYTEEEKSFDGGTFLPQVNVTLSDIDESTTFEALSGKLAVEYTPTDTSLIYASVSEGFKSGGYFGGFATSNAQLVPFDQETITAFEVGFKTDFPEQALRLNGAAFYYDRKDVQANGIDTSGIVNIARMTNIGDVDAYGMELETVWSPTSQLTIQGGASWLETEIVNSDKATSNIFGTSAAESFVGARIQNQPELSANFIARLEDNLGDNFVGGAQIEVSYRGEQDQKLIVNPLEGAIMTEEAYSLVNFRVDLSPNSDDWSFTAYVTNLFDEEYRTNAGATGPAGVFEIYGEPQIWGVTLDYRF